MKRTPLRKISPKKKGMSKEEYEFRKAVRKRDEACIRCGHNGEAVHHVYNRQYTIVATEPLNGVYLCKKCHRWAHSFKPKFREWLEEYLAKHNPVQHKYLFEVDE